MNKCVLILQYEWQIDNNFNSEFFPRIYVLLYMWLQLHSNVFYHVMPFEKNASKNNCYLLYFVMVILFAPPLQTATAIWICIYLLFFFVMSILTCIYALHGESLWSAKMQFQARNDLQAHCKMNNNNNNNNNHDNILILHCSMQLMCATTFSKEFSTKILEFYALEPCFGCRRFKRCRPRWVYFICGAWKLWHRCRTRVFVRWA